MKEVKRQGKLSDGRSCRDKAGKVTKWYPFFGVKTPPL